MLKEMLKELGLSEEPNADATWDELGIDSLDLACAIYELEESLGVDVEDHEFKELLTVGDLDRILRRKV